MSVHITHSARLKSQIHRLLGEQRAEVSGTERIDYEYTTRVGLLYQFLTQCKQPSAHFCIT